MILTPHTSQPPSGSPPSELARDLRVGTLLLPTPAGDGWADSIGGLRVTGGAGSVGTVVGREGYERATISGIYGASDFFQDRGALDPRNGYAWVFRGALESALGNWGGIIARTRDNGTTQGWAWQRTNSDIVQVYHAGGGVSLGITFSSLVDGNVHTLVGLWRKDRNRLELWRDGALLASASLSTVPDYTAGQGQLKTLSSRDTGTNVRGRVAMVAVMGGVPSEFEAAALSANPWLLFDEPDRAPPIFWVDAGPGAKELSGNTGIRFGMSGALQVPGARELSGIAALQIGLSGALSRKEVVIAQDDFTRETDGNLASPPWVKTALVGTGNLSTLGGYLRGLSAGSSAIYAYDTAPDSADYTVSLEIQCGTTANLNGSYVGVVGRFNDSDPTYQAVYYAARYVGASAQYVLERFTLFGDGLTTLGTYSAGIAASATVVLALRMVGDQIALLADGVPLIEVTDATISGAGKSGILAYNTTSTAWYGDDFALVGRAATGWAPQLFDGTDWGPAVAAWRHNGTAFEKIASSPVVMT